MNPFGFALRWLDRRFLGLRPLLRVLRYFSPGLYLSGKGVEVL